MTTDLRVPDEPEWVCASRTSMTGAWFNAAHNYDALRSIATAAVALVGERDKEIAQLVKSVDQNWITHQRIVAAEKRASAAESEREELREKIAANDKWYAGLLASLAKLISAIRKIDPAFADQLEALSANDQERADKMDRG